MRMLILVAGLTAASAGAFAGAEDRAQGRIVLANGCVYAPSASGPPDVFSLIYTQSGTTASCAHTLRRASPTVTAPPRAPVTHGRPRSVASPAYAVGVFR